MTIVTRTRFWDNYDITEWNKRQKEKMRAHQEFHHQFHATPSLSGNSSSESTTTTVATPTLKINHGPLRFRNLRTPTSNPQRVGRVQGQRIYSCRPSNPTKYWVQYDLRYGKSAPPIAWEDMMEVIPDYGYGVFYLDEDLKTMGLPFPSQKNPNIKYEVIILQYDMSEWNQRQNLLFGKSVPSIASEEIMDVIPDYGERVKYADDNLKKMGIVKKWVV
ncbi:hypothetical protein GCK72_022601 [Caenorhabditis remanei]|uniref:Uncharacterized protein n=1 Tax=Caenorhabditis remanei TaxID=31234 RepID=A0A6A5FU55_CAERE|nr:hypothetical protein GCK72_022601 [Caenorhabditis remanei]KAF1746148.1 hypothetical protein GCK72_022601 [Caenorhabditis remanei]